MVIYCVYVLSVVTACCLRNGCQGLACGDPNLTKYLAGQYHGWDTAHGWSFGADLAAGRPLTARARLICRRFDTAERMCDQIDQLCHTMSLPELDRELVDWLYAEFGDKTESMNPSVKKPGDMRFKKP